MREQGNSLVSVVIPAYNAEQTIERTVRSVLSQNYRPIEIVVVNDGSTDATSAVLNDIISESGDEQISIRLINQTNSGVSKARNVGMEASRGEFIALLDSDDTWRAGKLKRQLEIFRQNPEIDFLGAQRNGEKLDRWFFKRFDNLTVISARLLMYKVLFVTPTVVFRRKLIETVGYFDEKQRYAEEGDFWIRVCKDHRCVLLNEDVAITGDGKPNFGYSGLSSNLWGMEKGELKNLRTGRRLGIIGLPEYIFLTVYSILKYLRRVLIVFWRGK